MEIEKIIKGCQQNERKSQDRLVHVYAPALMAICIRYCNDSDIAKDALQETFINIFKYIKGYKGQGSFEGWMKRIAVNCTYAFIKKIRPIYFHEDINLHSQIPSNVPDIYSEISKNDLLTLIERLPRNQYLVFNMKVIEGFSHAEIGKILDITASTSRSNLTRARINLIKIMKESEYDYLVQEKENRKEASGINKNEKLIG